MKISCIDIGGTYIKSGVLEDGVLTDVEETPTDYFCKCEVLRKDRQ